MKVGRHLESLNYVRKIFGVLYLITDLLSLGMKISTTLPYLSNNGKRSSAVVSISMKTTN